MRNFILLIFHKILFRQYNFNSGKYKKILILRSCGLGDSVCALSAVNFIKLKYANAQIDLLTNDRNKNKSPGLAEITSPDFFNYVISYDKFLSLNLIKRIRKEKYDLFIALPSNDASLNFELRSMLLARLSYIKSGLGWKVSTTKIFKKKQEKYFIFCNETARLNIILKQYGLLKNNENFPSGEKIYRDDTVINEIEHLFTDNNVNNSLKNIALIISAGRNHNKWPLAYFQEIAKYYADRGYNIIFLGGKSEFAEAQNICEILKEENIYNFCGQSTALHTAEILRKCHFTISNDTGAMHLAYNAGIPVVAIFSNRDYPGKWFPPENENNIIHRAQNISCALCFSKSCSDNICMQVITPEMVIEKADKFL